MEPSEFDVDSDVIRARRLRSYLGEYWCRPDGRYSELASLVVSEPGYYVAECRSREDSLMAGCQSILAHGDYIWWESDYAYVWLERYMSNETLTQDLLQPRLVIVVFTGSEIPNKLLVPFVNQTGEIRGSSSLSTLALCLSPQPALSGRRVSPRSKGVVI